MCKNAHFPEAQGEVLSLLVLFNKQSKTQQFSVYSVIKQRKGRKS